MVSNTKIQKEKNCATVLMGKPGMQSAYDHLAIGRREKFFDPVLLKVKDFNKSVDTYKGVQYEPKKLVTFDDGKYTISPHTLEGLTVLHSVDDTCQFPNMLLFPLDDTTEKFYNIIKPKVEPNTYTYGTIGRLKGLNGIVTTANYVLLSGKPMVLKDFENPIFKPNTAPALCTFGPIQVPSYFQIDGELETSLTCVSDTVSALFKTEIRYQVETAEYFGLLTASDKGFTPWLFHKKLPNLSDSKSILESHGLRPEFMSNLSASRAKLILDFVLTT